MSWLLRVAWFFIVQHFQGRMLNRAKAMGVLGYMRALQGSRRFLIVALVVFMALQVTVLAGIGALVTVFVLWDYDFQTKMEILLAIFAVVFFGSVGLLSWLLSESFWYRVSGAQKMVDEIRESG